MQRKALLYSMTALALLVGCAETNDAATVENATSANGTAGTAGADALRADASAALGGAADETLMTLSGTVASTGPNWFRLNVGDEEVTVEMDDWDWFNEGKALKAGDRVTVTGRVDKGVWEQSKLEASSVYVRNLGVTFFASGADEEETVSALVPVDIVTSAQGLVTSVEGQEFTVGAMTGPVRVDATQVKSKPQVKVGDRVYSWGDLDLDPAEGVELMADGIVVLSPDRTKKAAANAAQQKSSSGPATPQPNAGS